MKNFGKCKLIKSRREPPSLEDTLTRSNFTSIKPVFGDHKCNKKGCMTCPNIYKTDSYNFKLTSLIYIFKKYKLNIFYITINNMR